MISTVGLHNSYACKPKYRQNFRYRTMQPEVKGKV